MNEGQKRAIIDYYNKVKRNYNEWKEMSIGHWTQITMVDGEMKAMRDVMDIIDPEGVYHDDGRTE